MVNEIKVYRERTMLLFRNWDKYIVDLPRAVVDKALSSGWNIKIWPQDTVKAAAVNRWYASNVTDELDAYIYETYPSIADELMSKVSQRKKDKLRVNRDIIDNVAKNILNW